MDNQFNNKGREQNIAQGDHAIGKQVNYYGDIPPAVFAEYAGKLAVTDSALASFFKILEEQQVPPGDLDAKLREIAKQYKELLRNWEAVQSTDPQAAKLKAEAKQAIDAGDFAKAEYLLEDVASHYSISAAETYAELASLQRVQLRYAKAAAYWQKAAALLPEESKQEMANCLGNAGYDFQLVASYSDALHLYEQSLCIMQKIGDKAGEGTMLNNISGIYHDRGDYATALKHLEQSLVIRREIGDREGEGATLNNISLIYKAQGDYATALKYLKQSLRITKEIGNKAGEGRTLNNLGQIYKARGDHPTSLKYLEQSLRITQEIGDRAGEAEASWNIGMIYIKQGDLAKAEQYISCTVQLEEEIGLPTLDESSKALTNIRAKIKAQ